MLVSKCCLKKKPAKEDEFADLAREQENGNDVGTGVKLEKNDAEKNGKLLT